MSETVCSVVVTYNRKKLLGVCLRALLTQTRPPDRIVIVDNGSTDGTLEMLAAEFPQLLVLPQKENLGGAGGFHAGMKWAYEQGYDWVWIMDDDVRTVPRALEMMLSYSGVGDFIQARKQEKPGLPMWEALWDPHACFPLDLTHDVSFANGKEWISVAYANFEGALMRRKVMEKIGFPDIRYFIGGDDSIYGFMASQHVSVIYIKFTAFEKDLPPPGIPRSRLSYYFPLRNRFLTYEHFIKSGVPVNRKLFYVHLYWTAFSLLRQVMRDSRERSWRNAKTVVQALRDGAMGRFGKPSWIR